MKIQFFTKNIDPTFYRQVILQYIVENVKNEKVYFQYKKYEKSWVIHVRPSSDWSGTDGRSADTGKLNSLIPHGVTGEGIVTAYVIDSPDRGLTSLQNFSAILHECAHMILIMIMRGKRGILRNNDLSGNKKGAQLNVSTQEVHDRQMEQKFFKFTSRVNISNWLTPKYITYTAVGIDLRDFLEIVS